MYRPEEGRSQDTRPYPGSNTPRITTPRTPRPYEEDPQQFTDIELTSVCLDEDYKVEERPYARGQLTPPDEDEEVEIELPMQDGKSSTNGADHEVHHQSNRKRFAIRAAIIGGLGGLLFGYDLGVIAGALPQLADEFSLTSQKEEMVVSLGLTGAIFGACCGGFVVDGLGRWWSIILTGAISIIASLVTSGSLNFEGVLFGRFLIGMAMSLSAIADVTYLTEVSPPEYRGAVVSTNELFTSIGILVAFVWGFLLSEAQDGWRYMLGIAAIFPVVQILCLLSLPESPTWLLSRGKRREAARAYAAIYSDPRVVMTELRRASSSSSASQRDTQVHIPSPSLGSYSRQVFLSLALMALQQFSGNIALLTYLPEVLLSEGLSRSRAQGVMVILGLAKCLATVITMVKIDQPSSGGRKPFLTRGSLMMMVGLMICSFAFGLHGRGLIFLASLGSLIAITAYASGFGPVTWLIVSELFPAPIRGRALGFSTIANWLCNLIVSSTFLTTINSFGPQATFLSYALSTLLAFVYIKICLPETFGKSPEQIALDVEERPLVCCHWSSRATPGESQSPKPAVLRSMSSAATSVNSPSPDRAIV